MTLQVRRLGAADAAEFQRLRLEAFRLQQREFRYAPEDEADFPLADVAARLERDFVVGAFENDIMIGVAGLSRFSGVKVAHKGLLWGMYVRAEYRSSGVADRLMSAIMDHAEGLIETITLTVIADNLRAVRFYERWGFAIYGTEPASVKLPNGDHLDEAFMVKRLV